MHGVLQMQEVDARGDVLLLRATPGTVQEMHSCSHQTIVIYGKPSVGPEPGGQTRGPKCHHSRHEKLEELGASSRKPYVVCSVHYLVLGRGRGSEA